MAGTRIAWEQVPWPLRAAAEQRLGGAVIAARTQPGGYSQGAAARLELSTGARAFAKAVGPELNPDSPGIYRAEARSAPGLPGRPGRGDPGLAAGSHRLALAAIPDT
jgi:hypothetical protein